MDNANPYHVVIIEDSPTDGAILARIIEKSGIARPTLVKDGLEGLSACFKGDVHAVILDLELPGMRGEEICRLLRSSARHRSLPIMIVSELPDAKRKEMEMLRIGADAYREKPYLEEELVDTLRDLLHQREAVTRVGDSGDTTEEKPAMIHPELHGDFDTPGPMGSAGYISLLLDGVIDGQDRPGGEDWGVKSQTGPGPFPDYELLDILGAGGMGTVYRARQIKLQRDVALKVLLEHLTEDDEVRRRFKREAIIMAQINHPNIVHLYDFGTTAYTSFLAMELVEGCSLQRRLNAGDLAWREKVDIVRQTLRAINHLHSHGVIHRDITPGNVLISSEGYVKITDFGISRSRARGLPADETTKGKRLGTWSYMAPEIMEGLPADERTDQYALGRTIWRLFVGAETRDIAATINDLVPALPRELSDAVARCLATDPKLRFDSVAAAGRAILEACGPIHELTGL